MIKGIVSSRSPRSPKSPRRSPKSPRRSPKSPRRSPKSPRRSPKSPRRSPKSPRRSLTRLSKMLTSRRSKIDPKNLSKKVNKSSFTTTNCPLHIRILDSESECKNYKNSCDRYLYKMDDDFYHCKKGMFTKKCSSKTGLKNKRGKCINNDVINKRISDRNNEKIKQKKSVDQLIDEVKTQTMLKEHKDNELARRFSIVTNKPPPRVKYNI